MRFLLLILILSFLNCSPSIDEVEDTPNTYQEKAPKIDNNKEEREEWITSRLRKVGDLFYDKDLDIYCEEKDHRCLPREEAVLNQVEGRNCSYEKTFEEIWPKIVDIYTTYLGKRANFIKVFDDFYQVKDCVAVYIIIKKDGVCTSLLGQRCKSFNFPVKSVPLEIFAEIK